MNICFPSPHCVCSVFTSKNFKRSPTMGLSTLIHGAVRAVRSYFHREWDVETLMNVNDHVPPFIRRHLEQLYLTVVGILASSAFGFYLHLTGNIGDLVAVIGYFVCIVWFPNIEPWRESRRICILITGAMFGGASLGPWITWFLQADPDFVVNALVGTFLALGCFGSASMWAQRFDLFSFSRLCFSNPLSLVWLFLGTLLVAGDSELLMFQIYTAILWFMLYVAVYSRELVQKIREGDGDYVNHAITLFTDSPAVCFHLINLVFWGACRALREMLEESLRDLLRRH